MQSYEMVQTCAEKVDSTVRLKADIITTYRNIRLEQRHWSICGVVL